MVEQNQQGQEYQGVGWYQRILQQLRRRLQINGLIDQIAQTTLIVKLFNSNLLRCQLQEPFIKKPFQYFQLLLSCFQPQNSNNSPCRFKLTYYRFPIQPNSQPIAIFDNPPTDNKWTFEHRHLKVNDHSMMVWFMPRSDKGWHFKVFQLVGPKLQPQFKDYNLPMTLQANIQCAILSVWELRPSQLLFVCMTNRNVPADQQPYNDNLVFDMNGETFRPAKFTFGSYQNNLIDFYKIGGVSMFRTHDIANGKAVRSPVYYVDNKMETIVAEESWICSCTHNYNFSGQDKDTLHQSVLSVMDVSEIILLKKKIQSKCLYAFLLTQLHPNWEMELVQGVMEMLE